LRTASASIACNSDLVGLSPMEGLSLETNDAPAATVLARKHSDYACRLALMALVGGHLALLTAPIKKRSYNEWLPAFRSIDFANAWTVLAIARSTSAGGKTGFPGVGDCGVAYLECDDCAKPLVGRAGCRPASGLFRQARSHSEQPPPSELGSQWVFFPVITGVVFSQSCAQRL
jgi:hypothetical protein